MDVRRYRWLIEMDKGQKAKALVPVEDKAIANHKLTQNELLVTLDEVKAVGGGEKMVLMDAD